MGTTRRAVIFGGVGVVSAVFTTSACGTGHPGPGKSPGTAPAPAPSPVQGRRILNVVAHHDDDLLFISPILGEELKAGTTVRTLYFAASDYKDYPQYMKDREQGVREAYALAAGLDPDGWRSQPYSAGGIQATLWTLGERISHLELRIPDGFRDTPVDSLRLWYLYAADKKIKTREGDTFPVQEIDRTAVVNFLRAIVEEFRPDVVNTLDPVADLHGYPDYNDKRFHQDHVAVSRLVVYALENWEKAPPTVCFRDYTIDSEPVNLPTKRIELKKAMFKKYVKRDDDARTNKAYGGWLERIYLSDTRWWEDLVIPLPAPFAGGTRPVPSVGRRYRVTHRGTGQALSVADTLLTTGGPEHPLTLAAVRRGWALALDRDGAAVFADFPPQGGGPVVFSKPSAAPEQALRLHGNPQQGYLLVLAASGLALVPGGRPGEQVGRARRTGAPDQRWDFTLI